MCRRGSEYAHVGVRNHEIPPFWFSAMHAGPMISAFLATGHLSVGHCKAISHETHDSTKGCFILLPLAPDVFIYRPGDQSNLNPVQ
jgi:hypothetical protein